MKFSELPVLKKVLWVIAIAYTFFAVALNVFVVVRPHGSSWDDVARWSSDWSWAVVVVLIVLIGISALIDYIGDSRRHAGQ